MLLPVQQTKRLRVNKHDEYIRYLFNQSSELGTQSPEQPSASSTSQACRKEPSLSHLETPKFCQEEMKSEAVDSLYQQVFIQEKGELKDSDVANAENVQSESLGS
jgi:hypothetical protein